MSKRRDPATRGNGSTRRQVLCGVAVALGSLAVGSQVRGTIPQQIPKEASGTEANATRTSLHQEVEFNATPQRIYAVLLESKQFAACTGMPAEITPSAGGAFSTFGGMIVGRNVELVPNKRIVQAWRPAHWDPGVYSIVKFELKAQGSGTMVVLDHTGFPAGNFDSLDSGWKARYWEPMKKFLG